MACTTDALSAKTVIRVYDGKRLGYICNYEVDPHDGKLTAVFVPGECRHFLQRVPEFRIPWCKITKIGEDAILVDVPPSVGECSCHAAPKKRFWFGF